MDVSNSGVQEGVMLSGDGVEIVEKASGFLKVVFQLYGK